MIGRGEPYPISDRTTDAAKRSRVDVEITIPRGKTPGVYKLERIGYETAGGELGYLAGGKYLRRPRRSSSKLSESPPTDQD
jgi:hypothetical protein